MIHQSFETGGSIAYLPTAMAIGAANGAVRELGGALTATPARRRAVAAGAVLAMVSLVVVGWIASRVLGRWLHTARGGARFAYGLVTLRAFLRCSDCRRLIRADAKVCSHCGYRKPEKRGRRERKQQRQPAAVA